jgi:hypothetical protein
VGLRSRYSTQSGALMRGQPGSFSRASGIAAAVLEDGLHQPVIGRVVVGERVCARAVTRASAVPVLRPWVGWTSAAPVRQTVEHMFKLGQGFGAPVPAGSERSSSEGTRQPRVGAPPHKSLLAG